ncbi:MAG: hypothetical protein AAF806_21965 [Bacteroidota bacterium]
MDQQLTWLNLLFAAIVLLGIYSLLRFADKRLTNASLSNPVFDRLKNTVHYGLLIYELLVIVVLGSIFVLINPILHGVIIGGIGIIGFQHLRNYLTGRLFQFDNHVAVGKQVKLSKQEGVISEIGRTGLYLQTTTGRHFIPYQEVYTQGYTLTNREDVGGFYQLKIETPEDKKGANQLLDLMATVPYLDWNHQPKISADDKNQDTLRVQVSVKEEKHVRELMTALNEWGYQAEME